MGLDISIRWVRKGAEKTVPYTNWDGSIKYLYADKDVHEYREDWLQGRGEFRTIREWVGNDRYGQYIPLTGDNYNTLVAAIKEELDRRIAEYKRNRQEHPEWYEEDDDFPWYLLNDDGYDNGLNKLYSMILKAPLYEEQGWIMELECDW